MPGFIAMKLCPDLIIIEPNFEKYKNISRIFRVILLDYDPNYVSYGLDEVCLDITDHLMKRLSFPKEQRTFQTDYTCELVTFIFDPIMNYAFQVYYSQAKTNQAYTTVPCLRRMWFVNWPKAKIICHLFVGSR